MENEKLSLLLKFAETIQVKYRTENDESIKQSLEQDLIKVKNEIGRIALELPPNVQIFQPIEYSQFVNNQLMETTKSNFSGTNEAKFSPTNNEIDQISQISLVQNEISSAIDLNEFESENKSKIENENSALDLSNEEIAARFDSFMKQKSSAKNQEQKVFKKSKIPKPTLKQK